jgi:hypothetical protein
VGALCLRCPRVGKQGRSIFFKKRKSFRIEADPLVLEPSARARSREDFVPFPPPPTPRPAAGGPRWRLPATDAIGRRRRARRRASCATRQSSPSQPEPAHRFPPPQRNRRQTKKKITHRIDRFAVALPGPCRAGTRARASHPAAHSDTGLANPLAPCFACGISFKTSGTGVTYQPRWRVGPGSQWAGPMVWGRGRGGILGSGPVLPAGRRARYKARGCPAGLPQFAALGASPARRLPLLRFLPVGVQFLCSGKLLASLPPPILLYSYLGEARCCSGS